MAYIPLIKKTIWVDLSDEHKLLRETLEQDTRSACCEKGNEQPIMLQGAFGIGKTTTLCYLFHYGWEILKTPTFYMPLARIVDAVAREANTRPSGKIQNDEINDIVSEMIQGQLQLLDSDNLSDITNLYFPEFKKGLTLKEYLKDFSPLNLNNNTQENTYKDFEKGFNEDVIRETMSTGNVPLILVDEFESKFYELKRYVESSGGGILRELFDQIVLEKDFYMVIGNGPASGYEVAKEFDDNQTGTDSETAANRRLKTKQIPFPTVDLLKENFLQGSPNGYVNFIWWLSRCRPGHIQRLKDYVRYETFEKYPFAEFISKPIFDEPIDNSGEPVKYLKSSYLSELNSYLHPMMKKLLLEMEPHLVEINDSNKRPLKDCYANFYSAEEDELIDVENQLVAALSTDINGHLKKLQEEGKYVNVNYLKVLNRYFFYILSACANAEGKMAFFMLGDADKKGTALAKTFIIPLLELTYDFISQYEDDLDIGVKETKDYILHCISWVNNALEDGNNDIENMFDETMSIYDSCRVKPNTSLYLQLSLLTIREIIEQPIGSPKLNYKDASLNHKLKCMGKGPVLFSTAQLGYVKIYFIPDLEDDQLTLYLASLKTALYNQFDNLRKEAQSIIKVVCLRDNEKIQDLWNELSVDWNGEVLPIVRLKKFTFSPIGDYLTNYEAQITDFMDSIAKITLVGHTEQELFDGDVTSVIDTIKVDTWTRKKEDRRTIEHFSKMVLEGDNGLFNVIKKTALDDFERTLESIICQKEDYEDKLEWDFDSIYDDNLDVVEAREKFIAQLYLLENAGKTDTIDDLFIDILKEVGDNASQNKMGNTFFHPCNYLLKYDQLYRMLNNKKATDCILQDCDMSSDFLSRLYNFTHMMTSDESPFDNTSEIVNYISGPLDEHWVSNYNELMAYNFKRGDTLLKLLHLHDLAKDYITPNRKELLINSLDNLGINMQSIRGNISSITNELRDNLYPRGGMNKEESLPFKNYLNSLSKVASLLSKLKKLLQEKEIGVASYLIIVSIKERICHIISSAEKVSSQIRRINYEIVSKRDWIRKNYQSAIDIIYQDPIVARLIMVEEEQDSSQRYDNDAFWMRYVSKLRNDNTMKKLLDADLHPTKENILKKEDMSEFLSYTNILKDNSIEWMNKKLELCQNARNRMHNYYSLKNHIEKLLNTDTL